MFPKEIEDLIFDYLAAMDEGSDLPSYQAIGKLISRSDVFVLNTLAFTMGMPTNELTRLRCRVELANDFVFYFRLSPFQRIRFIRLLKNGIIDNLATATMVWLFLVGPNLDKYPDYRKLFMNSLLIKFLRHFSVRGSILDQIV